jgi:hypothetical protein
VPDEHDEDEVAGPRARLQPDRGRFDPFACRPAVDARRVPRGVLTQIDNALLGEPVAIARRVDQPRGPPVEQRGVLLVAG